MDPAKLDSAAFAIIRQHFAAFFIIHTNGYRKIMGTVVILQFVSILVSLSPQLDYITSSVTAFLTVLPDQLSLLALVAALICSYLMMKSGSFFHKILLLAAMALLLCYAAAVLLSIPFAPKYALSVIFTIIPGYCYTLLVLWIICLAASTAALAAELLKKELERRLDISMLTTETKLAINSYKSLKQQYQEIHALRHDTAKHFYTLRAMVEHAPEKLSISDAELCSLIINILDNAINAASAPGLTEPYIRLDLMCKNIYFFFSCENSVANGSAEPEKPPAPEHGHGLKIIKQIVKKHSDIMSIEQSENAFKISIALPI